MKAIGIFAALASVGVVSAVAVIVLLMRQEEVKTPDVTGMDLVATIDALNQRGLQLKIERSEPHLSVPKDAVVSQTPAPGSGIKKGRPVRVVVSLGSSETLTPNLLAEHYRKAEIMIRQAGFLPGEVSRAHSEGVERDRVIAQDPAAYIPLEKGGKIRLLVSAGKGQARLVMPGLSGKKAEEAVNAVDRMGLHHRIVYRTSRESEPAKERIVTGQKPAAGYPVTSDDVVEIIVSK